MKIAVIIQGEGKGHFSQAMEAIALLHAQGDEVSGCYLGRSLFRKMPDYFRESAPMPLKPFLSPNFLRTPDRKGIHILLSLLLNLLLSPVYLFEAMRLGTMLRRDGSVQLLNLYDPVGALAGKWLKRTSRKTMISHHFYLSHPDFIHPHGMERSYFWLQLMNRIMTRKADEVLALSFRKGSRYGKIKVVPPLVAGALRQTAEQRETKERQQERNPGSTAEKDRAEEQGRGEHLQKTGEQHPDLCYFLSPGFVEEMLQYYRDRPRQEADIFLEDPGQFQPPGNVRLHRAERDPFLATMQQAGRVICTAGFDTVAEAFFLGIPVFVIPSENHYEQYCNALDAARTGMAFQLESLDELKDVVFEPRNNAKFVQWLETGHAGCFHAPGK